MRPTSPDRAAAIGHPRDGLGVVVIAGGRATRFGSDKPHAVLAGRTLLEHVLAGVEAGAEPVMVVVVGPRPPGRPEVAGVTFVLEEPRWGGPVAALRAGARTLPDAVRLVAVLAADTPFCGPAVPRLVQALAGAEAAVDAAVGVDPDGRRQHLLAAFRIDPLRRALDQLSPAGAAMKSVLARLRVAEVPLSAQESFDVDSPLDLARAEHLLRRDLGSPS